MYIKKLFPFLLSFLASFVAFSSQSQIVISVGNPVNATEGSSDITFDVFIEGGGLNTTGAPITGAISYGGMAVGGSDFVSVNSYSIPIGANSTTITLIVIDDALIEGAESITIMLTGAPSAGTYNNISTTAVIFDDDAASFGISINLLSDGAEGSTSLAYTVSLDNGAVNTTGSDIYGTLSYTGTATQGSDYTGVATFTIPNGANSTTVTLPVLDDALLECNETVIATITNVSAGTISTSSSTGIITDDECSQVAISIGSPVDGMEGGSNVSYIVSLNGGTINSTGSSITGSISYSGVATAAVDFSEVVTFSIPNGANQTTITIPVIDDGLLECDESIIATISNPSIGTIGTASSTAVIVDDECVQTGISIGNPVDGEEGVSDMSFLIYLEGGATNNTGAPITGLIAYSGSATASDFSGALPTTFSIAPGAASTQLVLPVLDDLCIENTESFTATISNPSTGAINNAVSTADLFDNDAASAIISIGSPVNGEEGAGVDVSFVISIEGGLMNCSGAPITGSISFSGTATAGTDYSNTSTFSIPDGGSTADLVLPVLDDPLDECDETVIATLMTVSMGSISTTAGSSTAIIIDDECSVGMDELNDSRLSIYPNPVSNIVNIRAEKMMSSYTIFDVNGRAISTENSPSTHFEIATDFLSSGAYVVHIQFEDGHVINRKVCKE